MEVLIGWIVLAIIVGSFGSDRKIGFWAAFGWSLFLSPVIGGIITAMSKSLDDEKKENEQHQINMALADKITSAGKPSVTEELVRLNNLKNTGAIDEEEFQKLKQKVINGQ